VYVDIDPRSTPIGMLIEVGSDEMKKPKQTAGMGRVNEGGRWRLWDTRLGL